MATVPPISIVVYILPFIAPAFAVARATPPAIRWWKRRRAGIDSAERIAQRLALKREIEQHLPSRSEYGIRGEAIIRDVRRVDRYPDVDDRGRRISPWFKVEVKDVYHRGVEVILSGHYFRLNKKKRTWQIVRRGEEANLKGYIVGRVPFDWIVQVDWEGDEYYGFPHFYCRFIGRRRQPYESIVVYYKAEESDFLWELEGYRQASNRLARMKRRLTALPRLVSRMAGSSVYSRG